MWPNPPLKMRLINEKSNQLYKFNSILYSKLAQVLKYLLLSMSTLSPLVDKRERERERERERGWDKWERKRGGRERNETEWRVYSPSLPTSFSDCATASHKLFCEINTTPGIFSDFIFLTLKNIMPCLHNNLMRNYDLSDIIYIKEGAVV